MFCIGWLRFFSVVDDGNEWVTVLLKGYRLFDICPEFPQLRCHVTLPTKSLPMTRPESARSSTTRGLSASDRERLALSKKLDQVNRLAELPECGASEEIFGDEAPEDDTFVFTKITGFNHLQPLLDDLAAYAEPVKIWDYEDWLKRGLCDRKTVIAIQRDDDPAYAGFAIVSTALTTGASDIASGEASVVILEVDLAAVYVAPKYRKQGFSEALSWAIGRYVDSIIDMVSDLPPEDIGIMAGSDLKVIVKGDAQSPGGARFLFNTVDEIRLNIEMRGAENGAFRVFLTSAVNLGEFADAVSVEADTDGHRVTSTAGLRP